MDHFLYKKFNCYNSISNKDINKIRNSNNFILDKNTINSIIIVISFKLIDFSQKKNWMEKSWYTFMKNKTSFWCNISMQYNEYIIKSNEKLMNINNKYKKH